MLFPPLGESSFERPKIMVFMDIEFSIIEYLNFLPLPVFLVGPAERISVYFFDLLNDNTNTFYNSLILSFSVGLTPVFSGLNPK